ncbi:Tim10/DDP zinc finger family protein [Leishmania donovani]|uniref:Tim10/DDP zinc finger family protein n=1 Tax=Leishmania donovani TaxID=5661 RepID=A0A504XP39_LEIDO|nr:Tim10/DDP zinc finger family protein [Leishmania donovani]
MQAQMMLGQALEHYSMMDFANLVLEQCWDICYDSQLTRPELAGGELPDVKVQKMDACARKCVARHFEVLTLLSATRELREKERMQGLPPGTLTSIIVATDPSKRETKRRAPAAVNPTAFDSCRAPPPAGSRVRLSRRARGYRLTRLAQRGERRLRLDLPRRVATGKGNASWTAAAARLVLGEPLLFLQCVSQPCAHQRRHATEVLLLCNEALRVAFMAAAAPSLPFPITAGAGSQLSSPADASPAKKAAREWQCVVARLLATRATRNTIDSGDVRRAPRPLSATAAQPGAHLACTNSHDAVATAITHVRAGAGPLGIAVELSPVERARRRAATAERQQRGGFSRMHAGTRGPLAGHALRVYRTGSRTPTWSHRTTCATHAGSTRAAASTFLSSFVGWEEQRTSRGRESLSSLGPSSWPQQPRVTRRLAAAWQRACAESYRHALVGRPTNTARRSSRCTWTFAAEEELRAHFQRALRWRSDTAAPAAGDEELMTEVELRSMAAFVVDTYVSLHKKPESGCRPGAALMLATRDLWGSSELQWQVLVLRVLADEVCAALGDSAACSMRASHWVSGATEFSVVYECIIVVAAAHLCVLRHGRYPRDVAGVAGADTRHGVADAWEATAVAPHSAHVVRATRRLVEGVLALCTRQDEGAILSPTRTDASDVCSLDSWLGGQLCCLAETSFRSLYSVRGHRDHRAALPEPSLLLLRLLVQSASWHGHCAAADVNGAQHLRHVCAAVLLIERVLERASEDRLAPCVDEVRAALWLPRRFACDDEGVDDAVRQRTPTPRQRAWAHSRSSYKDARLDGGTAALAAATGRFVCQVLDGSPPSISRLLLLPGNAPQLLRSTTGGPATPLDREMLAEDVVLLAPGMALGAAWRLRHACAEGPLLCTSPTASAPALEHTNATDAAGARRGAASKCSGVGDPDSAEHGPLLQRRDTLEQVWSRLCPSSTCTAAALLPAWWQVLSSRFFSSILSQLDPPEIARMAEAMVGTLSRLPPLLSAVHHEDRARARRSAGAARLKAKTEMREGAGEGAGVAQPRSAVLALQCTLASAPTDAARAEASQALLSRLCTALAASARSGEEDNADLTMERVHGAGVCLAVLLACASTSLRDQAAATHDFLAAVASLVDSRCHPQHRRRESNDVYSALRSWCSGAMGSIMLARHAQLAREAPRCEVSASTEHGSGEAPRRNPLVSLSPAAQLALWWEEQSSLQADPAAPLSRLRDSCYWTGMRIMRLCNTVAHLAATSTTASSALSSPQPPFLPAPSTRDAEAARVACTAVYDMLSLEHVCHLAIASAALPGPGEAREAWNAVAGPFAAAVPPTHAAHSSCACALATADAGVALFEGDLSSGDRVTNIFTHAMTAAREAGDSAMNVLQHRQGRLLNDRQHESLVEAMRDFSKRRCVKEAVALFYAHERQSRRLRLAEVELFAETAKRAPLPFLVRLLLYLPPPCESAVLARAIIAGAWKAYQRALHLHSRRLAAAAAERRRGSQRENAPLASSIHRQSCRRVEQAWYESLAVARRALALLPSAGGTDGCDEEAQRHALAVLQRFLCARPHSMQTGASPGRMPSSSTGVTVFADEWDSDAALCRLIQFCDATNDPATAVRAYLRFANAHAASAPPSRLSCAPAQDARKRSRPTVEANDGRVVPLLPLDTCVTLLRLASMHVVAACDEDAATYGVPGTTSSSTRVPLTALVTYVEARHVPSEVSSPETPTGSEEPRGGAMLMPDSLERNAAAEDAEMTMLLSMRTALKESAAAPSDIVVEAATAGAGSTSKPVGDAMLGDSGYHAHAKGAPGSAVSAAAAATSRAMTYATNCIAAVQRLSPTLPASLRCVLHSDSAAIPLTAVLHDALRWCRLRPQSVLAREGAATAVDGLDAAALHSLADRADSDDPATADVVARLLAAVFQLDSAEMAEMVDAAHPRPVHALVGAAAAAVTAAGVAPAMVDVAEGDATSSMVVTRHTFACRAARANQDFWRLVRHSDALLGYVWDYVWELYRLEATVLWVSPAQQQRAYLAVAECAQVILAALQALDVEWRLGSSVDEWRVQLRSGILQRLHARLFDEGDLPDATSGHRGETASAMLPCSLTSFGMTDTTAAAIAYMTTVMQHSSTAFETCAPTNALMQLAADPIAATSPAPSDESLSGSVMRTEGATSAQEVRELLSRTTQQYYDALSRLVSPSLPVSGGAGPLRPVYLSRLATDSLSYVLRCVTATAAAAPPRRPHTIGTLATSEAGGTAALLLRVAAAEGMLRHVASLVQHASVLMEATDAAPRTANVELPRTLWCLSGALHYAAALLDDCDIGSVFPSVNGSLVARSALTHVRAQLQRLVASFADLYVSGWYGSVHARLPEVTRARLWGRGESRAQHLRVCLVLQHLASVSGDAAVPARLARAAEALQQALARYPSSSAACTESKDARALQQSGFMDLDELVDGEHHDVTESVDCTAAATVRMLERTLLAYLTRSTQPDGVLVIAPGHMTAVSITALEASFQRAVMACLSPSHAALLWRLFTALLDDGCYPSVAVEDTPHEGSHDVPRPMRCERDAAAEGSLGVMCAVPTTLWRQLRRLGEESESEAASDVLRSSGARTEAPALHSERLALYAALLSRHPLVIMGVVRHPLVRHHQLAEARREQWPPVQVGASSGRVAGTSQAPSCEWLKKLLLYGAEDDSPLRERFVSALILAVLRDASLMCDGPSCAPIAFVSSSVAAAMAAQKRECMLLELVQHLGYVAPHAVRTAFRWVTCTPYPLTACAPASSFPADASPPARLKCSALSCTDVTTLRRLRVALLSCGPWPTTVARTLLEYATRVQRAATQETAPQAHAGDGQTPTMPFPEALELYQRQQQQPESKRHDMAEAPQALMATAQHRVDAMRGVRHPLLLRVLQHYADQEKDSARRERHCNGSGSAAPCGRGASSSSPVLSSTSDTVPTVHARGGRFAVGLSRRLPPAPAAPCSSVGSTRYGHSTGAGAPLSAIQLACEEGARLVNALRTDATFATDVMALPTKRVAATVMLAWRTLLVRAAELDCREQHWDSAGGDDGAVAAEVHNRTRNLSLREAGSRDRSCMTVLDVYAMFFLVASRTCDRLTAITPPLPQAKGRQWLVSGQRQLGSLKRELAAYWVAVLADEVVASQPVFRCSATSEAEAIRVRIDAYCRSSGDGGATHSPALGLVTLEEHLRRAQARLQAVAQEPSTFSSFPRTSYSPIAADDKAAAELSLLQKEAGAQLRDAGARLTSFPRSVTAEVSLRLAKEDARASPELAWSLWPPAALETYRLRACMRKSSDENTLVTVTVRNPVSVVTTPSGERQDNHRQAVRREGCGVRAATGGVPAVLFCGARQQATWNLEETCAMGIADAGDAVETDSLEDEVDSTAAGTSPAGAGVVMQALLDLVSLEDARLQQEQQQSRRQHAGFPSQTAISTHGTEGAVTTVAAEDKGGPTPAASPWAAFMPLSCVCGPSTPPARRGGELGADGIAWHSYLHVLHLCGDGLLCRVAQRRGRRASSSAVALTRVTHQLQRLASLSALEEQVTHSSVSSALRSRLLNGQDAQRIICFQLRGLQRIRDHVSVLGWTVEQHRELQLAQQSIVSTVAAICALQRRWHHGQQCPQREDAWDVATARIRLSTRVRRQVTAEMHEGHVHPVEQATAVCFYPALAHLLRQLSVTYPPSAVPAASAQEPSSSRQRSPVEDRVPRADDAATGVVTAFAGVVAASARRRHRPLHARAPQTTAATTTAESDNAAAALLTTVYGALCEAHEQQRSGSTDRRQNTGGGHTSTTPALAPVDSCGELHALLSAVVAAVQRRSRDADPWLLLEFLSGNEREALLPLAAAAEASYLETLMRAVALGASAPSHDEDSHRVVEAGLTLYALLHPWLPLSGAAWETCAMEAALSLVTLALPQRDRLDDKRGAGATVRSSATSLWYLVQVVLVSILHRQQSARLSVRSIVLLGVIYSQLRNLEGVRGGVLGTERSRRSSRTAPQADANVLLWRILSALSGLSEKDAAEVRDAWMSMREVDAVALGPSIAEHAPARTTDGAALASAEENIQLRTETGGAKAEVCSGAHVIEVLYHGSLQALGEGGSGGGATEQVSGRWKSPLLLAATRLRTWLACEDVAVASPIRTTASSRDSAAGATLHACTASRLVLPQLCVLEEALCGMLKGVDEEAGGAGNRSRTGRGATSRGVPGPLAVRRDRLACLRAYTLYAELKRTCSAPLWRRQHCCLQNHAQNGDCNSTQHDDDRSRRDCVGDVASLVLELAVVATLSAADASPHSRHSGAVSDAHQLALLSTFVRCCDALGTPLPSLPCPQRLLRWGRERSSATPAVARVAPPRATGLGRVGVDAHAAVRHLATTLLFRLAEDVPLSAPSARAILHDWRAVLTPLQALRRVTSAFPTPGARLPEVDAGADVGSGHGSVWLLSTSSAGLQWAPVCQADPSSPKLTGRLDVSSSDADTGGGDADTGGGDAAQPTVQQPQPQSRRRHCHHDQSLQGIYYTTLRLLWSRGHLAKLPLPVLLKELLRPLAELERAAAETSTLFPTATEAAQRAVQPAVRGRDDGAAGVNRKTANRLAALVDVAQQLSMHPVLSASAAAAAARGGDGSSGAGWTSACLVFKLLAQIEAALCTRCGKPQSHTSGGARAAFAKVACISPSRVFAARYADLLAQRGTCAPDYLAFMLVVSRHCQELLPTHGGGAPGESETHEERRRLLRHAQLRHAVALAAPPPAVGAVMGLFQLHTAHCHRAMAAEQHSGAPPATGSAAALETNTTNQRQRVDGEEGIGGEADILLGALTPDEQTLLQRLHHLLQTSRGKPAPPLKGRGTK